ncbi:hypothetical protein QFZ87_004850 [Bacillus sp. SLBN-46]|uniref:hypothetical protein n=1 Tax=Bacillus sp. SLBN-46 TaxID=3042283 RepID=UPI00285B0D7B|nr:hypothetical protein [Bacillus sp. SLBN-46]MDR6125253.1 hypothetical protein [Bacillus sp. SLBN-46]
MIIAQHKLEEALKARQLRTGQAKKSETLSEDKASSDTSKRKERNIVRREGNFGQSMR